MSKKSLTKEEMQLLATTAKQVAIIEDAFGLGKHPVFEAYVDVTNVSRMRKSGVRSLLHLHKIAHAAQVSVVDMLSSTPVEIPQSAIDKARAWWTSSTKAADRAKRKLD